MSWQYFIDWFKYIKYTKVAKHWIKRSKAMRAAESVSGNFMYVQKPVVLPNEPAYTFYYTELWGVQVLQSDNETTNFYQFFCLNSTTKQLVFPKPHPFHPKNDIFGFFCNLCASGKFTAVSIYR